MDKNKILNDINLETLHLTSDVFLLFAKYGVISDDVKITNSNDDPDFKEITFFISVPEKSHLILESGEEASGEALAKMLKRSIIDRRTKHVITCLEKLVGPVTDVPHLNNFIEVTETTTKIRFEVRDEEWTREKEEKSTMQMITILSIANKLKSN